MAHTFTPPTVQVVPPFLPSTKGQAFRLFRHYAVQYRGVNVYVLSDGTVTTDYPVTLTGDVQSTVNIPLPMNPTEMGVDKTNTEYGGEQPPLKNQWGPGSTPVAGSPPYEWVTDPLASPEVSSYALGTGGGQPACLISWFRGGCGPYTISNAMYTLLNSAGFGAFLT